MTGVKEQIALGSQERGVDSAFLRTEAYYGFLASSYDVALVLTNAVLVCSGPHY